MGTTGHHIIVSAMAIHDHAMSEIRSTDLSNLSTVTQGRVVQHQPGILEMELPIPISLCFLRNRAREGCQAHALFTVGTTTRHTCFNRQNAQACDQNTSHSKSTKKDKSPNTYTVRYTTNTHTRRTFAAISSNNAVTNVIPS